MRRLLNIKFLLSLLAAILIAHILATYYYWYWQIWWFDIPMHLAGGFLVGVLVLWYAERYKKEFFGSLNFLERFSLVLGTAALVGVFWEFYEFFLDVFLLKNQLVFYLTQLGVSDTMKDLADDLMGAAGAFLIFRDTARR